MCKKNRLTSPVLTYLAISVFLIRFIAEGLCKYPFLFPLSLGGLTVGLIVSLLLIIVDRYGCKNRYCEIMFNILRQFMVMFVVFGTVGLFLYGIVSVHIGFLYLRRSYFADMLFLVLYPSFWIGSQLYYFLRNHG